MLYSALLYSARAGAQRGCALPLHHILTGVKVQGVAAGTQVDLVGALEALLWEAAVPALFGQRFWARSGGPALRPAFAAFEAGFELATSPLPHALQPGFRAARRTLLAALRCAPGESVRD